MILNNVSEKEIFYSKGIDKVLKWNYYIKNRFFNRNKVVI